MCVFVCAFESVCVCLVCDLLCDFAWHGCFPVLCVCVFVCFCRSKCVCFVCKLLCGVVWFMFGVFLCLWIVVCVILVNVFVCCD